MSLTIETVGGTINTTNEVITPGSFAIGLDLDGMEYGGAGAVANFQYAIPSLSELQYYKSQGQDLIRLPISWATLQSALNGPLTASYLSNIESVVNNAASLGMKVILDLHNFGGYEGNQLGSAAVTDSDFANVWTQLATAFAGNSGIGGYDLMNEPNNMPSATAWTSAAQAAITAIRTVDTKSTIYVEGNEWSNSMSWSSLNPGLAQLQDPSNNLVFSAHLYLDTTDSGTNYDWATQQAAGETTMIGVQRLQNFVSWLQANNLKGDIGEIGVGNNNPAWLTALDNTLAYAKASNLQVTYWAAGPWLGSFPMSAEPTNGVNAPQMAVLDKYSGQYPTLSVAALSGTADPNATVYLSENEVILGTVQANAAGDWSDTLTGLANGVHIIVAGESLPTVDGSICATVFDLISSQPPLLSGMASAETTTSEAPINPFARTTINDPNANASDTLTITLSGTGGVLTGAGLTEGTNGVYTLTGSAGALTSELQGLRFTANPGGPNTANTTTLALSDLSSVYGTAVTGLTMITDLDPAVAPSMSGTPSDPSTASEAPINPFANTTITDPNANASETLTIRLSGTGGVLTGAGLAGGTNGVYTLTGTAGAVTSELQALTFTARAGTPNTTNTTTLALSDLSSAYGTAITGFTTVTDIDPAVAPIIVGTLSDPSTTSEAPINPFATTTINDPNANASETLTITLSGAGGTLTGSGLTDGAKGQYTLTGTAGIVTSELRALTFNAAAGGPNTANTTTLGLSDLSSAYGTAINGFTTVIDIDPAVAPIIAGVQSGQMTAAKSSIAPFAAVTITDPNANATDTLTIKLTGTNGTLAGAGLTGGTGGVYSLSGAVAQITKELQAVTFTPNAGSGSANKTATLALSDVSNAYSTATVNTLTTVLDVGSATVVAKAATLTVSTVISKTTLVDTGGTEAILSGGAVTKSILNGGTQTVAAGGKATGTAIDNGGTQAVVAGATVSQSVIGGGGTEILTWGATVSGSIDFSGSNATLSVAGPSAPNNTIIGFDANGATGDEIVIPTVLYNANDTVTLKTGNVLAVDLGGTVYDVQFDPSQSFAGDYFGMTANSQGQAVIFDPPVKSAAAPAITAAVTAAHAGTPRMEFLSPATTPRHSYGLWDSTMPADRIGRTGALHAGGSYGATQIARPDLLAIEPYTAQGNIPVVSEHGRTQTAYLMNYATVTTTPW